MTLPADLDPFYPIFDSADWLERLLPLGIRLVQLRVKDRSAAETRAEIRRARDLAAAHGATLVINDYWRLAIEEGCAWVHLGQEDLDEADIPAIRAAGLKIGLSTHDDAELARALSHDPDYVALGPIYPTILKAMRFAPQGLDKLADWKRRIGALPLVGIGGVSLERGPGVLAAGADSVSAVTDITLNSDPEGRIRDWLSATRPRSGASVSDLGTAPGTTDPRQRAGTSQDAAGARVAPHTAPAAPGGAEVADRGPSEPARR